MVRDTETTNVPCKVRLGVVFFPGRPYVDIVGLAVAVDVAFLVARDMANKQVVPSRPVATPSEVAQGLGTARLRLPLVALLRPPRRCEVLARRPALPGPVVTAVRPGGP